MGELGGNQIVLHGEEGEAKRADPRRDKGEKHLEGNWSGEVHVRGNQVNGDEKTDLGRAVTGVFGWRLKSWVKDSPHTPFILISPGCYNEVM